MKLVVEDLPRRLKIAATLAEFDRPIDEQLKRYLQDTGLGAAESRAVGCMNWIWHHWLAATPEAEIRARVEVFVDQGMEMRMLSPRSEGRAMHDLYLLHCAAFASSDAQLKSLAERVVDASGDGTFTPEERFGERYASAWCGMLKYWILGDRKKAVQQSEVVWGAYRDSSFRGATKPLVTPWLKDDWKSFVKSQQKDFEKLWVRSRKDGTVKSEKDDEVIVSTNFFSIPQLWCWAHCGMAMLAHRQGAEIATDSFWFPSHALKVVPKP